MAEAPGNRTQRGRLSTTASGFEVRGGHQTPFASVSYQPHILPTKPLRRQPLSSRTGRADLPRPWDPEQLLEHSLRPVLNLALRRTTMDLEQGGMPWSKVQCQVPQKWKPR